VREGTPVQLPVWLTRLFRREATQSEQDAREEARMAQLAREIHKDDGEKS
jgi:hypothetical protein